MPTGRLTFDGGYFFADGKPVGPVSMIEDATITEDDSLADNTIAIDWVDVGATFTGELKISRRMRMMLLYGWRAKGPIRKRLLMRLRFGKHGWGIF